MSRMLIAIVMVVVSASAAGRAVAMSETARSAGCIIDCPRCDAGEPCSRRPCRLTCPGGVHPCGPAMCERGEVCCNESCGICTQPNGVCTQQFCTEDRCAERSDCDVDFHWSEERCACVPDEIGHCRTSADCELFSDYCTGCDCRSLAIGDPIPACGLPGVRCFADPCMDKRALCQRGRCQVTQTCLEEVPCRRGYRWSSEQCACLKDRSPRERRKHRPRMPHAPRSPR